MSIFAELEQFSMAQARRKMRISRLCHEFGALADTPMSPAFKRVARKVDMSEEWFMERLAARAVEIWKVDAVTAREYAAEVFEIIGRKTLLALSKQVHG